MSTPPVTIPDNIRHLLPTGRNEDGTLIFPKGVDPIYVRTSERTTFKKCRRLWKYTSQNMMNLERVKMNNNLGFGIDVHKGLQYFYDPATWHYPTEVRMNLAVLAFVTSIEKRQSKEDKARSGLDDERKQEFAELTELGEGMITGYAEWSEKEDKGITPIAVEKKYQVLIVDEEGIPLIINGRPVVYQIRVDVLLRDEYEQLWVMDHKTAKSLGDLAFLELDTQLGTYPWVAESVLGERVKGTLYNELVKSVPEKPKVLKKGNLSQDKRQNTTFELYMEAIRENGLDIGPYETMLDYLRENPRDYFRRTPDPRTPEQLEYQGTLVLNEIRDMFIGTSGEGAFIYPTPNKFNCNNCDFYAPSVIENERGDVKFILNDPGVYRQRVSDEDEEELI